MTTRFKPRIDMYLIDGPGAMSQSCFPPDTVALEHAFIASCTSFSSAAHNAMAMLRCRQTAYSPLRAFGLLRSGNARECPLPQICSIW